MSQLSSRPRAQTSRPGFGFRGVLVLLVSLLGATLFALRFGGSFLVAPDPLPGRAQVAVALAGSVGAEEARRAEALRLLQVGRADHVMLSVGKVWFWGEWMPDLARRYLAKKYGEEMAKRVVLCEMNADSTAEEVRALLGCLRERGWRSVIVVTSNYHTRRARLIWRRVVADAHPPFTVAVHGVSDGDFEASGWWRRRRHAKTWLLEITKLVWAYPSEGARAP